MTGYAETTSRTPPEKHTSKTKIDWKIHPSVTLSIRTKLVSRKIGYPLCQNQEMRASLMSHSPKRSTSTTMIPWPRVLERPKRISRLLLEVAADLTSRIYVMMTYFDAQ